MMSMRRTKTAHERLARHRKQAELGERLLSRGLAIETMSLDETRAVQTAYQRRIVNSRATLKHLDPRSQERALIEADVALWNKLLKHYILPQVARLHSEAILQIVDEYRLKEPGNDY